MKRYRVYRDRYNTETGDNGSGLFTYKFVCAVDTLEEARTIARAIAGTPHGRRGYVNVGEVYEGHIGTGMPVAIFTGDRETTPKKYT